MLANFPSIPTELEDGGSSVSDLTGGDMALSLLDEDI